MTDIWKPGGAVLRFCLLFLTSENTKVKKRNNFIAKMQRRKREMAAPDFHTDTPLEIQLSRGGTWDTINRFNLATFLCLSQDRTWISNVTCRGLFVFSEFS